jgi:hypothetical protein
MAIFNSYVKLPEGTGMIISSHWMDLLTSSTLAVDSLSFPRSEKLGCQLHNVDEIG